MWAGVGTPGLRPHPRRRKPGRVCVQRFSWLALVAAAQVSSGCRPKGPPSPRPAATGIANASAVPSPAPPVAATSAPVSSTASPPEAPKPWPAQPLPVIDTDWCIEGLGTLDEDTCVVLPAERSTTLLIYLHGIVPPERTSIQKTNFETVVANASRRAGIVALIPRGKQGLAPKGHERWWGWPTATPSYRKYGEGFAQVFIEKRARLEALVGVRFERTYVAGSSSGAYFAAALALHGGIDADGFGAISGGAGARTPELDGLPPKPVYVGFGTHDSVAGSARALAKLLQGAGWPVKVASHPVPHGAREIYLDEAIAFWREHAR